MSKPATTSAIRLATVEDASAIAQVHIASWRATYPGIVPQHYIDSLRIDEFTDRWKGRLATQSEMLIYVADADGAVCGFASGGPARANIAGFSGELYAIYLTPELHSKGIGSRLFWAVAEHLKRAGHASMYVWVLEENPSQGFYQQMGGCRISTAEIELGGKPLKEVSYGWPDLDAALSRSRALARQKTKCG
jgi:GNAT superfamily N-acetyltransferase